MTDSITVPRELLNGKCLVDISLLRQIVDAWGNPTGAQAMFRAMDKLKVLLDAPAVEPVASIYITPNGEREFDDWKVPLPVGRTELFTAPQAQQPAPVQEPVGIDQIAADRYRVVPSHDSMFHRWAVVAGDGAQQLYIGREADCQYVARKFAGAFLDGAYLAQQPRKAESKEETSLRAVKLSDEEIKDAGFDSVEGRYMLPHTFARAIEQAVWAKLGVTE